VNPGVYPREPTVAQLLTGLMQDAQLLLRHEVALAIYELRGELRTTIRAVLYLSLGLGLAALGGWLLLLMLVHLLQALTGLPLWACYGLVGGLFAGIGVVLLVLGKRRLAPRHLVPQHTVETMQENVQWLNAQVTTHGRSRSGGPQ
jgi:Putative Actinobacterial Holin-X, holin superfamily III